MQMRFYATCVVSPADFAGVFIQDDAPHLKLAICIYLDTQLPNRIMVNDKTILGEKYFKAVFCKNHSREFQL